MGFSGWRDTITCTNEIHPRPGKIPLVAFALGLALAAGTANGRENISLTVDATQTPRKMLHAKLVIPVKPGPVTLYYPKWIPGEHGPDGPISSVTGLTFEADGETIPWQRDLLDVYTFHVNVPAGATHLNASYDYIEPDGYSSTDKLLVLEWNEVLLYPAGTPSKDAIYDAKLMLPDGWKFGTSLPLVGQSANAIAFRPIALDLLVDSPVIAGQFYRSIDLTPTGESIQHEIDFAADSEAALNMSPAVQKQLTNLVAESGKLFGARHYRDYHFLLALSDDVAHFGLEHHESNDSRLPDRTLLEPNASAVVGGLLPHEFAHSWNGKFRRPSDLTTPDFEKPMEDDLLWGYEGLTEFLGPLLAARSELFTPEEYREYLASAVAAGWDSLVPAMSRHRGLSECGLSKFGMSICGEREKDKKVCSAIESMATTFETEVLAEEWQHVILEAVSNSAGVCAFVDFEAVCYPVLVEYVVQFGGIGAQAVLVSDVNGDGAVLAQVTDILIDKCERGVRRPFRENVRLSITVLRGKIEIQRRILRVRRPGGCAGKLRPQHEGEFGKIFLCLGSFDRLFKICRSGRAGRQTARAHDVKAAEHIRMLHADTRGSIASHRMSH